MIGGEEVVTVLEEFCGKKLFSAVDGATSKVQAVTPSERELIAGCDLSSELPSNVGEETSTTKEGAPHPPCKLASCFSPTILALKRGGGVSGKLNCLVVIAGPASIPGVIGGPVEPSGASASGKLIEMAGKLESLRFRWTLRRYLAELPSLSSSVRCFFA